MSPTTTIATRVLDVLVDGGVVTADQLASVRSSAADDAEAGRLLLERGLIAEDQLAGVLEDDMGFPRVDLESYAPDDEALQLVPATIARAFGILPLFEIEGTLTVALGHPRDIFALDQAGEQLGFGMDAVLADSDAVARAIVQHFGEDEPVIPEIKPVEFPPQVDTLEVSAGDFFELEEQVPVMPEAPAAEGEPSAENVGQTVQDVVESEAPEGAPSVDLDVLAVADERTVAVLVSSILEQAVSRHATRIHLLPYKTDFFLVFRIQGRLEKIASAPLSMQQPLIEGFKSYAKLSSIAADRPALGRIHADIGGKEVVLTVSSVPTVAGQRLVVSISPVRPEPKTLAELGMTDAESRALYAMVERGRGLLLVAAPVAGGRSTTYYSLLQHAAQVGKTVYSVERSIEYEIPAVAQVLVSPGQPIEASSYFAAGIRQDTDVLALDSIHTVEDIHLAIEAAGLGKLVIATCAGGGIIPGVRRLLDLGAEPVSLANALTLGVGQRVVRTVCPNCSVEEASPIVGLIPGSTPGMTSRRGAGCPNCAKTGFAGATGLFEVLPFTEPVRAVISRGASADEIGAAAHAAGMRPMVASGLAKVQDGLVSVEELDRVLRFAQ